MASPPTPVPDLQLSSGQPFPAIGLGTWKSAPKKVGEAVKHAILEAGYRHIDCAEVYGNEDEIGEALEEVYASGKVSRNDIFITSKVFNYYHGDRVPTSVEKTLASLRTDYVDLLLMHWPIAFEQTDPPKPMRQENGIPHPDLKIYFEFLDTWAELEKVQRAGKARSIGVCNFTVQQLRELCAAAAIPPAVNQVEMHPLLHQRDLLQYCAENGIVVTAYSPLGSPDSYSGRLASAPKLLRHPTVLEVAQETGRSPGNVLIRWGVQHGMAVIPKSVTPSRIEENIDVFSWSLSAAQLDRLDALHTGHRFGLGWMPGHFLPDALPQ